MYVVHPLAMRFPVESIWSDRKIIMHDLLQTLKSPQTKGIALHRTYEITSIETNVIDSGLLHLVVHAQMES